MSLPYYKRFPRDFLDGTIGMSLETKGAYAIVLDLIYMRDGRLIDDARYIAGQLGCSVRKWTAILEELTSAGKLQVSNGIISNFRADYLTEESRKYQDKQAEIAGKPRKNKGVQHPSIQPEPSQSESEPKKEEAKASLSPDVATTYPEPFEAAWKAYPHVKGRSSKPKALGFWRRMPPAARQALPSAVARYARDGREPRAECGAPGMHRWLSEARYEDWLGAAAPAVSIAVEPQVLAGRQLHFAKTGEWRAEWGPRPPPPQVQAA